jgi:hypothetical protein
MKYLVASSLILCAIILSRKPKEPTDPNTTKNAVKTSISSTRS